MAQEGAQVVAVDIDGDPNTRADWDATLAVNLTGPYNMVTAFLDQLRETKAAVINIGSIQSFVALPNTWCNIIAGQLSA
ncbi:MAG: SDR family NAD(P)-dependent oxidoreductase [Alphaproteobacteria bacterium]|nr:SDR family NAD(P)-dependent oxidoreductase [Alphaproteobacteria bacterium]